ncbi:MULTISPECIES: hypothetical protein [unclassified Janthinobacterium]|uniref:hypothetical protein n=1 Tax=unclassified Janthinobacterium TaxID=2610881 RepID=UPI00160B1BF3|nr:MULTISPECIES: hypothetical protein [unclassified Janthinobacterium]MBB5606673.1 hypothetical protein [Janthinobacterium sp. S3T4]MBB5612277.1 hypothetical protein [Janthinobacterium sp. S3M3]
MRPAPPLWVWPLGAALATVAALLMLLWMNHTIGLEPPGLAAAYARRVLEAPRSPGDIRVVGMGSSLLMAATPPSYQTAYHLRWIRLSNPGLGVSFLGASLVQVEQHPPDILIIEKNLLLVDPQHERMGRLRGEVTLGLRKIAAIAIPSLTQTNQVDDALQKQDEDLSCAQLPKPPNEVDFEKYMDLLNTTYTSLQVDSSLTAAVQRLARRGVYIVILDIQRSKTIEHLTTNAKQAWFAHLQQELPPGARLAYWTSPSYDNGALYCDGSHLSPDGKRQFSVWWYQQLAQLKKTIS